MDLEKLLKGKLYIDMPSLRTVCGFYSINGGTTTAYIKEVVLDGDGWNLDDPAKVCKEIKEAIIEIIHKHRSGNNGNG